jgi:hypothetical protein
MSKPSYWRYLHMSLAWRIAAPVVLIAGAIAHGAGAPMSVFFIGMTLMVVCLVVSVYFGVVLEKKARQDNYGVRIRTGDPEQDRVLNAEVARRSQEEISKTRPPRMWPVVLTVIFFWPAVFSVVIAVTSAHPSTITWVAAALFPVLFVWSAVELVRLNLPSRRYGHSTSGT